MAHSVVALLCILLLNFSPLGGDTCIYLLSLTVCVGEWSGRWRSSVVYIDWCPLVASSLVNRQWRSSVGRWLQQSSHTSAQQSTTTTTHPNWQSQVKSCEAAKTIILQFYVLHRSGLTAYLIHTRIDHANSLIHGSTNIKKLQRVQTLVARVVSPNLSQQPATALLSELHWLRVNSVE